METVFYLLRKKKRFIFIDRSYDLTKRKGVHAFSCGQFRSWIEDVNVNNDLCTYSPCTVINSLYWWMCLSIIYIGCKQVRCERSIKDSKCIITCLMHGFLDLNVKLKWTFTSTVHWFLVVPKLQNWKYIYICLFTLALTTNFIANET